MSPSQALLFDGTSPRKATTTSLDLSRGGFVQFTVWIPTLTYFRAGSLENPANPCYDFPEPGEDLVLQYSPQDSCSWEWCAYKELWRTNMDEAYGFQSYAPGIVVTVPLPPEAWTAGTNLRWTQVGPDGWDKDVWALDDVTVYNLQPPPDTADVQPLGPASCSAGSATWEYACVAASGTSDASCKTTQGGPGDSFACVAAAPAGDASCDADYGAYEFRQCAAISLFADAGCSTAGAWSVTGRCYAISGRGDATADGYGGVAVSDTGDATTDGSIGMAVSGRGDATSSGYGGMAVSGTGDASAEGGLGVAVSGTGRANAPTRASPCDGARVVGVDVVQGDPAIPLCPWVEWLDGALGNAGGP